MLDNSVDTVFISWGSFPLKETLREIDRVLKPNGIAIRIGVLGKDDYTSLFPKFDLKRLRRINREFERANYTKEEHVVTIKFSTLKLAKKVLSKVLKVKTNKITAHTILHKVVLYSYIKKQNGL